MVCDICKNVQFKLEINLHFSYVDSDMAVSTDHLIIIHIICSSGYTRP